MSRFLLVLFFFPLSLLGQGLERSFGLEVIPHANQRRVSGVGSVSFRELEKIDSLESGTPGYGIGLVYESRVDRIGFTTGLRYTRTGYQTVEQQGADAGAVFSDKVTANYLAVPFELNFYQEVTENDRVSFMLGAGIQFHLGTKVIRTTSRSGSETEELTVGDDIAYRNFLASFVTGVGYDRKLSTDWAIRVQPTFQFFLNGNLSPTPDTRANRNFYQLGLRLVLRRLFI